MATNDDSYAVYWETGGSNHMTALDLSTFPCDSASWVAFVLLLEGQRRYAPMTVHAPENLKIKAKIIPAGRVTSGMTYESIN